MNDYEATIKPKADRVLAALGLLVLSPALLLIAVAIRLEDAGPAFFRQRRVGAKGTQFELLKFRTYPEGTPEVTSAAAAQLHPTRIGRVLRRLSLDELPQLLNVLSGEMSLVGPRPQLPSQTEVLDGREDCGANRLRPGMTGLAQINSYEGMMSREKVAWDCRYAASVSWSCDLRIIGSTVLYLLRPPPTY